MDNRDILVHFGTDGKAMAQALCARLDLAGDIGDKRARIGLKPNLVVAKPASSGATTHPEVLEGVIVYLREQGFSDIVILEGSWVGDRTARAFAACGYEDLSRRYNVPLIDTQKDSYRSIDCRGMKMQICEAYFSLDYLINFPVLKGHCQTGMTGALKNAKGLISDKEKRQFHSMGLHKPIAHLNAFIKNGLVLVDGLCGDLNFEEGGNPVPMNRLIAAKDPVLCDAYLCRLMGFELEEVPFIGMAAALGVGSCDVDAANISLIGDQTGARPPKEQTRKLARLAPFAQESAACSACYASLIHALERMDGRGSLPALSGRKVCVGQGFEGQGGQVGVGKCTAGFEKSLPGCPPDAMAIVRFLEDL